MIVADTNLIVYLFLTGDQTRLAQKVLAKDPNWIVPPLWQSEFRNVLAAYIRRGMAVSRAKRLMSDALQTLEKREILPLTKRYWISLQKVITPPTIVSLWH